MQGLLFILSGPAWFFEIFIAAFLIILPLSLSAFALAAVLRLPFRPDSLITSLVCGGISGCIGYGIGLFYAVSRI
jgi:hypothetical protein